MPQVSAPRRLGVALDHDLARSPAPAHVKFEGQTSRQHRATRRSAENMILGQGQPSSPSEEFWRGHGFAGNIQFAPFVGKQKLRPGVKLERDIQLSTMPRENARPMNTTQMPRHIVEGFLTAGSPSVDAQQEHEGATACLRCLRDVASETERRENPHRHARRELELSQARQAHLEEQARAMQNLRSAGLSSINPRLGASTSLPDFSQLSGREGIDTWRRSTPWAIDNL